MATAITSITAKQLWENPPDGRCELVRGELIEMSPASSEHGWVVMNASVPIGAFVQQQELGFVFGAETGFLIHQNPDSVRAPDLAFVRKERVDGPLPRGFFPGAPDLAIEVLSPSDSASEVQEKTEDWLCAGCREVWIIDPRRQLATRWMIENEALVAYAADELSSELLPGFRLEVQTLFQ